MKTNLTAQDYANAAAQNANNAEWLGNVTGQRFCLSMILDGQHVFGKSDYHFDSLDAARDDEDKWSVISSRVKPLSRLPKFVANALAQKRRNGQFLRDGAELNADTPVKVFNALVNGRGHVTLYAPECWA